MKKKTISLILALILLLSCSATAQATSVQAATPSASITINGTTATCRVSIAKPGKTIHSFINEDGYRWATLSFSCPNLFGETMSGEWSPDSANSYKDATP